jgi:phytoene synthase
VTPVEAAQQTENTNRAGLQANAHAAHGTPERITPSDDDIAYVHAVVRDAGSSFYGAMRTLPPPQREAMFAIYAFCREIDDIADDPLPTGEKIVALAEWRAEIGRLYDGAPQNAISRALIEPIATYGLDKGDFLALIDGMEMDAKEDLRGPSMDELVLYCERVAGAVGRLSVRVFGAHGEHSDPLAWALGQALQLTNILRDLQEDADRGRLYLPAELLDKYGIETRDPAAVLAHPGLPGVCGELAATARQRFKEATAATRHFDRRKMRPAIVMMQVYRRILDKLIDRGWRRVDQPVRISKLGKIFIALRYGFF